MGERQWSGHRRDGRAHRGGPVPGWRVALTLYGRTSELELRSLVGEGTQVKNQKAKLSSTVALMRAGDLRLAS